LAASHQAWRLSTSSQRCMRVSGLSPHHSSQPDV
jgi:hypothetical protein